MKSPFVATKIGLGTLYRPDRTAKNSRDVSPGESFIDVKMENFDFVKPEPRET
jgi:hypothetical protein